MKLLLTSASALTLGIATLVGLTHTSPKAAESAPVTTAAESTPAHTWWVFTWDEDLNVRHNYRCERADQDWATTSYRFVTDASPAAGLERVNGRIIDMQDNVQVLFGYNESLTLTFWRSKESCDRNVQVRNSIGNVEYANAQRMRAAQGNLNKYR